MDKVVESVNNVDNFSVYICRHGRKCRKFLKKQEVWKVLQDACKKCYVNRIEIVRGGSVAVETLSITDR